MADNQFKTSSDEVWERENQWSIWTTGHDLHTTHEKRVPYIIDTEKVYGIPEHGIGTSDAPGSRGPVAPEVRGASEGTPGAPTNSENETLND